MTQGTPVASGNITGSEPSGVIAGDLLVAFLSYRDSAAFTLPASWTLVATQQSSGNVIVGSTSSISSGVMAYIVRAGSAPSFAFTRTAGDVADICVVAYRGNTATPYDTGSANTLASNNLTANTPTLTTAEDSELLVSGVAVARNASCSAFDAATGATTDSGAASENTTAPALNTWTQRRQGSSATGADEGIGVGDAIMGTAGATGTLSALTAGSSRHVLIVGAFKKAA